MAGKNEITADPDEIATARRFSELADQWRRETARLSNPERIVLHPSYQRIIGMGREAIPLILNEISVRPGHWFWALNAITGEDPVPAGASFRQGIEAWLGWGRSKGFI